jgi:hypothetical protein
VSLVTLSTGYIRQLLTPELLDAGRLPRCNIQRRAESSDIAWWRESFWWGLSKRYTQKLIYGWSKTVWQRSRFSDYNTGIDCCSWCRIIAQRPAQGWEDKRQHAVVESHRECPGLSRQSVVGSIWALLLCKHL